MKYLKYFGLTLAILFLLLILFVLSRFIAHEYLGFLASSVTNSCALHRTTSCGLFEWDVELRAAAYISYISVFGIVTLMAASLLKNRKSKIINRLAILIYVCSFPTYTTWYTASSEYHTCYTCSPKDVWVPVIMTFNISSIFSIVLAGISVWIYTHYKKVLI